MSAGFFVSVIMPAYNARRHLAHSIAAIEKSDHRAFELIVVDDASTDDSAAAARAHGAAVISLDRQRGPAAARNRGAEAAKGELLLFIDADVLVRPDTIALVVDDFSKRPEIAAVFGSYDDEPAARNFLSQYKNLIHHFVHQQSSTEAVTFWAGCGAIRREVFVELGGFNERLYRFPSIEDIELGHRMRQQGHRIYLDKHLQVKHLKRWDLIGLLRADIFYRAVPWSRLILQSGHMPNDLNLQFSQKISAGLVMTLLTTLLLAFAGIELLFWAALLAVTVCLLNHKLYRFLIKKRGLGFAVLAVPMQFLYYIYSSLVFAILWLHKRLQTTRSPSGSASNPPRNISKS